MTQRLPVIILCVLLHITAFAQVSSILGDWCTVDDKTGEQRSIVTIYQGEDGLYYGAISSLLIGDPTWTCPLCPDEDKDAPIVGLVIIRGMQYDEKNNHLSGGKVLDPESGKFYYGKIYTKDGKLILRGSLDKRGILGRNQTWIRK